MNSGSMRTQPPLREIAYSNLMDRILSGDLAPGTKLTEAQISQDLGISRTPLREALSRLEREGFVQQDLAKGYSIRLLTEREVREVYPILSSLEVLAIEESKHLLISTLGKLKKINDDLANAPDPQSAIHLDSLWHDTLISRCSNQRLLSMITEFRRTVFRYENVYMSDVDLISHSLDQHKRIIEYIEAGDLNAAKSEVLENYRFGMEAVIQKISQGD